MSEDRLVRPLTAGDLPALLAWRNHPAVRKFMFTQHEITMTEHWNWFAEAIKQSSRRLMVAEDNHGLIGFFQLSHSGFGEVADWGFYVNPDGLTGSGMRLGISALNYAFNELGLHKVCGQAIITNLASIAFHKKLGFEQEGQLRDHKFIGATYHSLVCFGMLASDWRPDRFTLKGST